MFHGKISNGHLIDKHCTVKGELVDDNGVYSCTLNQTDINSNKNKFYIMQLICQNQNSYLLFIRYGRIGNNGKIITKTFTIDNGKYEFEKIFKTKTGNNWSERNSFVNKKGKYFLSEINYKEVLPMITNTPIQNIVIPPSKLDNKVQDLIKLLSDINMMNDTLIKMDIDPKKLPLGKIQRSQIEKADKVLNYIYDALVANRTNILVDYSNQYYTLIPYDCGRSKPPIIDNIEIVSKYRNILEDLKNMIIGVEIINNANNQLNINPIDSIYTDLNTEINYLSPTEDIHKYITTYFNNTHGATHKFKLMLKDIYQVKRFGNEETFNRGLGNVKLLIHGSRLSNWTSILKTNLMLDPSKLGVYVSGKMFGYGIYFANSFSKSAQYCGIESRDHLEQFVLL